MRAQTLQDLLKKGDRVAVSNVTGRESTKVSVVSQSYCDNIVAGWALGKGGQTIPVPGAHDIKVFGQFDTLRSSLHRTRDGDRVRVAFLVD